MCDKKEQHKQKRSSIIPKTQNTADNIDSTTNNRISYLSMKRVPHLLKLYTQSITKTTEKLYQ